MTLDIRTLLLVLTLARLIQAAGLLYVWRTHKGYPPARDWAIGAVVIAIGTLLVAFRGIIAPGLSIVGGNLFLFAGVLVFDAGIVRACDKAPPVRIGLSALALAAAALMWFTVVEPSVVARVWDFTGLVVLCNGYTAAVAFRSLHSGLRATQRVLATLLLVEAALSILRSVAVQETGLGDVLDSTTGQAIFMLGILATTFLITLGLAILTSQRLQIEVEAAGRRLESALEGSRAALWDADLKTEQVFLSATWADIVGGPRGVTWTTVKELMDLVHPEDLEHARRASLEAMKGIIPEYSIDHRVRTRGGEWKWILTRGRVTERDPASGRALRMMGTNLEITDRKRIEAHLRAAAMTDSLTGLANRVALNEHLRAAIARSKRTGKPFALLYLDIDLFKEINDTFGHAAGDATLKEFALRLRSCVREIDTVARLGGDEFVVLVEDMSTALSAEGVAEKILAALSAPLRIEGHERTITTSIGIAQGAGDDNAEVLLQRADSALYEAKNAGRNMYRLEADML